MEVNGLLHGPTASPPAKNDENGPDILSHNRSAGWDSKSRTSEQKASRLTTHFCTYKKNRACNSLAFHS